MNLIIEETGDEGTQQEIQEAHKAVANTIACAFLQSFPLGSFLNTNYVRSRLYSLIMPQLETAYNTGYLTGMMNK